MSNEQKKTQAVKILGDEIWNITDKLDKACLLLQDILDDYFDKYNNQEKDNNLWILQGFNRYATCTNIVNDYVYEAYKEALALKERVREVEKEAS